MCDHVWIFEARTLSTQPVRRRCGMCGVYRMEPWPRALFLPGVNSVSSPSLGMVLDLAATVRKPQLAHTAMCGGLSA